MPRDFRSRDNIVMDQLRLTDAIVKSKSSFCLFQNGSVGSQVIMGIPRLQQLRQSPKLAGQIQVWPFETGWAPASGPWLAESTRVVLAEIYPSVRDPRDDSVKDRGQVRAMWHWAQSRDAAAELQARFARPGQLSDQQEELARTEEGWVLH